MAIRPAHEQISTELLEENASKIRQMLYKLLQSARTSTSPSFSLYMADGNTTNAVISIAYGAEKTPFFMKPPGHKVTVVVNIKNPQTRVVMATRSFRGEILTESQNPVTFLSRSDTMKGFEGLGFGTVLFDESSTILKSAIRHFSTLFQHRQVFLSVQDDAKGRDLKFNREDWTSRRAESVGFTPIDPGSGEFLLEIK